MSGRRMNVNRPEELTSTALDSLNWVPLEDATILEKAKPITLDGKVKLDPVKQTARHDAEVKAVLDKGPSA